MNLPTAEQRARLAKFLGELSENKTVALDQRLEKTGEVLVDADVAGYLIVNSGPWRSEPDRPTTPPIVLAERRCLIWHDVADKDLGGEWIAANLKKLWEGSRFEVYDALYSGFAPISGNFLPSDWAGKIFISARCVQWNSRASWYCVLTPADDILLEGPVEPMNEEEIAELRARRPLDNTYGTLSQITLKMNWVTRPW